MAKQILRPGVRYKRPKTKPRTMKEKAETMFPPQQDNTRTRGATSPLGGQAIGTLLGMTGLGAMGKLAQKAKGRGR